MSTVFEYLFMKLHFQEFDLNQKQQDLHIDFQVLLALNHQEMLQAEGLYFCQFHLQF